MIKLCVLDLDGTLLNDGRLFDDDRKNLVEIQKRGITLMLATGRNMQEVVQFVEKLELKGYQGIVTYSDGQYLYDFKDHTYREFEYLDYAEDVQRIYKLYKGKRPVSLYSKKLDYQLYRSRFSKNYIKQNIKKAFQRSKIKILLANRKYSISDIDKVAFYAAEGELALSKLKQDYGVIYTNDKQRYELKHKNVNKARAVKEIVTKYRFTNDEIVVFGNDENDICLFEEYHNSFCMKEADVYTRSKARNLISREDIVPTIYRLIEGLT